MNNKILFSFVTYMSVLTQVSYGQTNTLEQQQMIQQQQQAEMQNPAQHEMQRSVLMTQQIAENWLKKVDAGDYAGSWSNAALFLQLTFTESEWSELLNLLRKPLG